MTGPIDVAIGEDWLVAAQSMRVVLERHGHRAREATTAAALMEMVRTRSPQDVLLDLQFGSDDGAALIPRIKAIDPNIKVFVWSGRVDDADLSGADAVFIKALTPIEEIVARLTPPRTHPGPPR